MRKCSLFVRCRLWKFALLSVATFIAGSVHAQAQIYTEPLSPSQIEAAIKVGQDDLILDTTLKSGGGGIYAVVYPFGHYSTPFLRVAAAARQAKRNYKPYSTADVDPALLEPVLHIYAYPQSHVSRPIVFNVTQVVIVPRKGKEAEKRAAAKVPMRMEPLPMTLANLFGAKFDGEGKIAVFPLELLSEDNEVRAVYEADLEHKDRLRTVTPTGSKRVLH